MNVKLISLTQPAFELRNQGISSAEDLLVYEARVSNPSNQLNTETADKLIGFMIKNRHWSPFDMINLTVEVTTSKAVGIQILRHWSIKPQEFSQRYAEVTDIEPIQLRKAGSTNRQSSEEEFNPEIHYEPSIVIDEEEGIPITEIVFSDGKASELIKLHNENTQKLYKALLQVGVAKECARMILPMATSTTMYLNGSVRSWIHYMEQRCDQHAQLEHREVAEEIKKIFVSNFPMIAKALGIDE